jgi:DNA-binding FadR family transcriptional regulator
MNEAEGEIDVAVTERPIMPSGAQQTLSDVVYDKLLGLIADGTWPPRSRLPSEAALVSQFAISRPVVRQALARLRENGLIASRQGSGSFVQDVARLEPEVVFPRIGSIADLERFLAFREGVEGEAAAAAATSHTEQRRAELKRAVETVSVTPEGDFEFHLAVAMASENPFYVNTLTSLKEQLLFGMKLGRSFADADDKVGSTIAGQHAAIAAAILDRDPVRARELMRSHLKWSRERILTGSAEP